jgi:hypothetical protein
MQELISRPNIYVRSIWIGDDGKLSIYHDCWYYSEKYRFHSPDVFQYCDDSWICHWDSHTRRMRPPPRFQLTEKTAVGITVAMLHQDSIKDKYYLFGKAKHYGITKLMLLHEIATKYLHRDLLTVLFHFTE